MDGAQALALPTRLGQYLEVEKIKSASSELHWRGLDNQGKIWFQANFKLWDLGLVLQDLQPSQEELFLQRLLQMARAHNPQFLNDERMSVQAITRLEFPRQWGLGSSSTLIYNVAKWAEICPFELQFEILGGSGYDIACANAQGPILYEKNGDGPRAIPISFSPPFASKLYFIYMENKANTSRAIDHYLGSSVDKVKFARKLSDITSKLSQVRELANFESLLQEHEVFISQSLKISRVQETLFSDYWGVVKSLGAWGGDFVLATSVRDLQETCSYFEQKGYPFCLTYNEMIYSNEAAH